MDRSYSQVWRMYVFFDNFNLETKEVRLIGLGDDVIRIMLRQVYQFRFFLIRFANSQ